MIAFVVVALLVGQAQSIFLPRPLSAATLNTAIGQVCVSQPGIANSVACVPCAFSNAVQCANTNFFNGANSRFVEITDQGQVGETITQVSYYCTRTQVNTCTAMMNLATGSTLTREQLQCIRLNCPTTIQVFFRLNGQIQVNTGTTQNNLLG